MLKKRLQWGKEKQCNAEKNLRLQNNQTKKNDNNFFIIVHSKRHFTLSLKFFHAFGYTHIEILNLWFILVKYIRSIDLKSESVYLALFVV